MQRDNDLRDEKKQKAAPKQTVVPATKAPTIFAFLEAQHWGEERESVDKIVLCAAHGNLGMRQGPVIREWSFAPREKPAREKLIEMSNACLQLAEADCDALGRPTRYVVLAYDLARSDRAIGRVLIRLNPSGTTTALADERGGGFEDEEGNGLTAKLLLGLLEAERRDKRWTMELAMNAISGAMERDAERIERMEQIVDGSWQKQTEMMKATEAMLNQAADREAKERWARWKQEKIDYAIEKSLAIGELLLPPMLKKVLPPPPPGANPVRDFLETVTEEQGARAFGTFDTNQTRLTDGVFTDEQLQLFMSIAKSDAIDDAAAGRLIASIKPEQVAKCREIFEFQQIAVLAQWFSARTAATDAAP